MFGWLRFRKKKDAQDWALAIMEEFKRLQESVLFSQRNHHALEGIVSELTYKMQALEDQFRFFKKKRSKEMKCRKLPLRK